MNKLKQEIEEYLTRDYCCEFKKECKDGVRVRCSEYEAKLYLILRFAEPREKQIQIDAEQIRALQKQNGELTDKVRELEHQLTHRNCLDCSNHSSKLRMRTLELEKENAELKEFVNAPHTKGRKTTRADYIKTVWDLSKRLTKAK